MLRCRVPGSGPVENAGPCSEMVWDEARTAALDGDASAGIPQVPNWQIISSHEPAWVGPPGPRSHPHPGKGGEEQVGRVS